MKILIKKGHVIDPDTKKDGIFDILIEDNIIGQVGKDLSKEKEIKPDQVIDASGCLVMPGFIDLHVHLRDPGFTYKEDIASGGEAAVRGGFTTICAMPNTKPVADHKEVIQYVMNKAKDVSPANVLQIGAVTEKQQGEKLADIRGMVQAGAPAISEDGKSVMNAQLYKKAMKIAAEEGVPVFAHCEDINMVNHGVMNAGPKAEELGLPGISNAVEDVIIARDILIAKETGARLHLCHCSTEDSVKMVAEAKKAGLPVTAEVCPHHFTLSSEDIADEDGNYKMNPPLRSPQDVEALKAGLAADIMDVIATDHAPHAAKEKQQTMLSAPFGIVGLETAAALTITELVGPGILTPMQMAEKMSYNPAQILGIDKGSLKEGKIADLVVLDPDEEYIIDVNEFASKGKNTPFDQKKVKGRVKYTFVDGNLVYKA